MCLFKQYHKVQVATEDIVTWKYLGLNMLSPFYVFQYKLGFHYNKKWTPDFIKWADEHKEIGGNCFHSSTDLEYCKNMYEESYRKLYKCIIPKGSKYYKGLFGEIGSEQIIIVEQVNE